MGYRMAANLRRALPTSTALIINDLDREACEKFKSEFIEYGPIEIASTAREAASQASTILSIVTASAHVRAVYLDEETGVINAPPDADRLMLECSTIDLATTRRIHEKLSAAGMGVYIDAPVSVRLGRSGIA